MLAAAAAADRARWTTILTVSARQALGFTAMSAVLVPSLMALFWALPQLPVPFTVVLVLNAAAILVVVRLAYEIRAWIDPSFDPSFAAQRLF
jgi:Na+/glutamate symporter